ncbi:MAG: hypothetical protein JWS12_587 [Candidatus Saccharibacteria bacterium]|nr:hypothetical protein [Candidatus Saccharibacteria bacterium]
MAKIELSTKRIQISKANATMVGIIAAASFVAVFSLVASNALLSQRKYQNKVVKAKETARDQLKANITAVANLKTSYQSFTQTPENVIGGNPSGVGDRDGDNAKIVLDALPSIYDFPALTSSVEKLVSSGGFKIDSITGTDLGTPSDSSPSPKPQEIPFEVAVTTDYTKTQNLINLFEKSIRPFKINSISFSGSQTDLKMDIKAKTYYQPAKSLSITNKEVK